MKQVVPPLKASEPKLPLQDGYTLLTGSWLLPVRLIWAALVVFVLTVFAANLPPYLVLMQTLCSGNHCSTGQLSTNGVRALASIGVSLHAYATFKLILVLFSALVWLSVALVIVWRKSSDWMALLTALFLVTMGTQEATTVLASNSSPWPVPSQLVQGGAFVLLFLVFSLFPNGRFRPSWIRWLVVGFALFEVGNFLPISPTPGSPLDILIELSQMLLYVGFWGSLISAQFKRYRHFSSQVERQQIKWVIYSIAIVLVGEIALFLTAFPDSLASQLLVGNLTYLLPVLIPLSLGFAILRYRLWDIDLIINRTLLYGTLTLGVVGSYALGVVGLGTIFEARGSFILSLLVTGLIAVLFQPVHLRLQRAVNRLMYGERDEPYRVISRLGQRLEATLAPEAVLPTIVETVAQALKLPYAAITLKQDREYVIAASYGQAPVTLMRLMLVYQNEQIGELLLAPRALGETFSSRDQALLDDLARQAGIAVHAVRLTTDLQHLTQELQHSRTQLVTAREEERRRLRRDLHDGLGSVLASLNWRAGAIRSLLSRDPDAADRLVVEQQNTIQAAIADIRRLVYGLRPPALDELGLVGAIRARVAQQATPAERDDTQGLRIDVVVPDHLPPLSAAVEVAAYRIVQEALANVIHHAHAHRCSIRLECSKEFLRVEVTDDGTGLSDGYHVGVGLLSMRERAEELGGTCEITEAPSGGTRLQACLPLSRE